VKLPIHVDGHQVGSLVFLPLPQLESSYDLDFAQSQLRSGVVTALVVLLLATLASMIFARRLGLPLRWMADRAKRIADGDYAARVAMDRGDEIGELGRDFDAMAEALQRNREARQRWTAEISHELRTPIAVMRAELDALEDGVRQFDAQALHSLSAETERLTRLVEDLYQLSLADAGALAYRFESQDLAELLREALATQAKALDKAGLMLETELVASAPVEADAGRLGQLWANLAANSCRYTDRGGRVRVSLQAGPGHWRLVWEDSTPGVPEAALSQLFDPLYRVDASRSRALAGAGLGLAIVRRIVDAHGARIWAEASNLGGVSIVVEWPRS
jgi:two-component system, OmpR family, sensor histidine kinase BaeS